MLWSIAQGRPLADVHGPPLPIAGTPHLRAEGGGGSSGGAGSGGGKDPQQQAELNQSLNMGLTTLLGLAFLAYQLGSGSGSRASEISFQEFKMRLLAQVAAGGKEPHWAQGTGLGRPVRWADAGHGLSAAGFAKALCGDMLWPTSQRLLGIYSSGEGRGLQMSGGAGERGCLPS